MAIKSINPYINFNGDAAQALEFYAAALGGKVDSVMRFGEVKEMPTPPGDKDRIMHARLDIGDLMLMLSDGLSTMSIPKDGNVRIALHFDSAEDLQKKFDALSQGGKVEMPVQDTFWGAKFGMLKDKFNVDWMFNYDKPKG